MFFRMVIGGQAVEKVTLKDVKAFIRDMKRRDDIKEIKTPVSHFNGPGKHYQIETWTDDKKVSYTSTTIHMKAL